MYQALLVVCRSAQASASSRKEGTNMARLRPRPCSHLTSNHVNRLGGQKKHVCMYRPDSSSPEIILGWNDEAKLARCGPR